MKKIKKESLLKKSSENMEGITLIALVITIIVLLILAGVSIATLTGENGILTQASTAKEKTKYASIHERIQVDVMGSYGNDGKLNIEELNNNLSNIDGIKGLPISKLPATVTVDGNDFRIEDDGKTMPVEKLTDLQNREMFSRKTDTNAEDEYGNFIKIPAGFRVRIDETTNSADTVNEGIVVEDEKGNQFVWIPVGNIYTSVEHTDTNKKTIELKRYVFDTFGNVDEALSRTEPHEHINRSEDIDDIFFTEALKDETSENAHAKDIKAFVESSKTNHGYYIGRYEAGIINYDKNNIETENTNKELVWTGYVAEEGKKLEVVSKKGQQVWNNITQKKASEVTQNMYVGKSYESDLINSYAWDTAIVFIQQCGTKTNSTKYSIEIGMATDKSKEALTGEGTLFKTKNVDEQCNIYDMAGNVWEWATDTFSYVDNPCVYRGGIYNQGATYFTKMRDVLSADQVYSGISFRPILYL